MAALKRISEQYLEVLKTCKALGKDASAPNIIEMVSKQFPCASNVIYSAANRGYLEGTGTTTAKGHQVYKVGPEGNAVLKNVDQYVVTPYKGSGVKLRTEEQKQMDAKDRNRTKSRERYHMKKAEQAAKAAEVAATALPENISANTAQFVDGLSGVLHENVALREAMEKVCNQLAGYLDMVVLKRKDFEAMQKQLEQ